MKGALGIDVRVEEALAADMGSDMGAEEGNILASPTHHPQHSATAQSMAELGRQEQAGGRDPSSESARVDEAMAAKAVTAAKSHGAMADSMALWRHCDSKAWRVATGD